MSGRVTLRRAMGHGCSGWKVVHRDRFGGELRTWDGCGTKAEAFALLLSLFNERRAGRGLPPFANWGLAVTCTRHCRELRAYPLLYDGTRLFEEELGGTWRAVPEDSVD